MPHPLRVSIIALALLTTAHALALEPVELGVGVGMESRIDSGLNPDDADFHNEGQIYGLVRTWPWGLLIEEDQERRDSAVGSLRLLSHTTTVGLWGRYEFLTPRFWSPFVAVGGGAKWDQVTSTFEGSFDSRSGLRGFGGVGVGVSTVIFDHLLVEAEVRVVGVEAQAQPSVAGLLRIGLAGTKKALAPSLAQE